LVTSDRDVTEQTVLTWTSIISTVCGAALTPLSMTRVGVSLLQKALTAGDLATAGTSIGIGTDQENRNKPEGTSSIVNGLMPLVLRGALKGSEWSAKKFAHGDADTSQGPQQPASTSNSSIGKPFFGTPERINGQIGFRMSPKGASTWKSTTSTEDQIASEFILPEHMQALAKASKKGGFAVSFRKAGALTLEKLGKGAATKGHDILEKTIKESSIKAYYPKDYATIMQKVKAAGIDGYVGHWEEGKGLVGIYLSDSHGLSNVKVVNEHGATHYIYPIDLNHLTESLAPLKSLPEWERIPFTGDYDIHDMITFKGAGRPRSTLSASDEETQIINLITKAVSEVDIHRPHTPPSSKSTESINDHSVIKHGAQVNYVNFMILSEKETFKQKGLVLSVAEPGEFPLAMLDRGTWSIIRNKSQLKAFYEGVGAVMKEAWTDNGAVKYHSYGYMRTNTQGFVGKRTIPDIPRSGSSSSSSGGSEGDDMLD
ncbi:MAG TPA: hypothetical protein VL997_03740, partial [Dyella sp.]|nr:hypothetical protein [Dyella sp.]